MSLHISRIAREVHLAYLLYSAIEDSDLSSVKLLLNDKKANPNVILPKKRISPFHLVIGNDSEDFALDVILLMLQHGGNPNVSDDDGLTPMHIAAAWGRCEILKLLLYCGGDPEVQDINTNTPLYYALKENNMECFNLLRSFVTNELPLIYEERDICNKYRLTLERILINNERTVGEYELLNEYKTSEKVQRKAIARLQELPQSDSKENVITWFNSHPEIPGANDDLCKKCSLKSNNFSLTCLTPTSLSNYDRKSSDQASFVTVPKKRSDESGVITLQDDIVNDKSKCTNPIKTETSSDYVTCSANSSGSLDVLEKNIYEITEDLSCTCDDEKSVKSAPGSCLTKSEGIGSSDCTFVSVSEVYKYEDKEEGIALYERRFLKISLSDFNGSIKSGGSKISSKSSLPETIEYEDCNSDALRKELTLHGYNPGPITVTTKRIYLKKLKQLKKHPVIINTSETSKRVYSAELQRTLSSANWVTDIDRLKHLDDSLFKQFQTPDPTRRWREGTNKSSFTYLLLDPRISNNLPCRADNLKPEEVWSTFLSAIFYVGKGKRSRPYSHLYDAVALWNRGTVTSEKKKLDHILSIWRDDCGVVCVHLFQNTIPVEAYTREAAMISALKLDNLCNAKTGDFYGIAATWSFKDKARLGVYLLYKAMKIFLNEGERQLCPADID